MRQGKASRDGRYGGKVEPMPHAYRPGGVGQLGNIQGSHVTSGPDSDYRGEPLVGGRGYKAPPVKSQSSNRGSQGKY
jgi:hypothetical protein